MSKSELKTANDRRQVTAAHKTATAVREAFELFGEALPRRMAIIGRLRLNHPDASLRELARLTDPPVSKDVVSSLLRRMIVLVQDEKTRRHHAVLRGQNPSRPELVS